MDDADGDYPDPPVATDAVEPEALQRRLDEGRPVRLLDVRNRDEVDRWRIEGGGVTATTIPYARFLEAQVGGTVGDLAADVDGEGPITVVCGRGEASDYVAGLLTEAGIEARNLAGGMTAWARVVRHAAIDAGAVTLHQYRRPASGCLSYAVSDGGETVVVDPLRSLADRYVSDAGERGEAVVAVVDTHVHADHVSGLREVAETAGVEPILPEGAPERGLAFEARTVAPGETIPVGDAAVEPVALPGHTTEMTGFAAGDALLTGDSVFLDGVARPDLQEDVDPAEMAGTLHETLTERLAAFDPGTLIAPGHHRPGRTAGPDGRVVGTLERVRGEVPGFDLDRATFVTRILAGDPPEPANAGRIVAINLGRETVADETAFELELGPNNCAAAASPE